jgi:hypothetical protein
MTVILREMFSPETWLKAEYPVRRSFSVRSPAPRNTGSPAGACHRAALCADPVAGDDGGECGTRLYATIEPSLREAQRRSNPSRRGGKARKYGLLRCARNDGAPNFGHHFAISRRCAPELCMNPSPPERAWGMPDAQCTRGLVCNCSDRTHTSNNEYTGIIRHSRTQWF